MGAGEWLQEKWLTWNRASKSGVRGERLAAAWLRQAGYKIVAQNWRNPGDRRDEIDLVCADCEVLVFVEVKTRSAAALVSGYYAIDHRKKKALRRAIDAYLKALPPQNRPRTIRFDVVEIQTAFQQRDIVNHFENVPLFSKDYLP